ncbi:hypothetical protein HPTD01_1839 [Halomonas sp. TD01]|nr:hypothetical protein GME_18178 [Halomonas sp. TD01]CAH1043361.1 hypothetical protein HPTD01_1839 [Halomonas sp. TD01]
MNRIATDGKSSNDQRVTLGYAGRLFFNDRPRCSNYMPFYRH